MVASEVKSLAGQTARATDDIRAQIDLIRDATARSVAEIAAIRGAVYDLRASATTVAAAIHQQSAATERIAEGAASTASHVGTATEAVHKVEGAIGRTGDAAKTVLDMSRILAQRSSELDDALAVMVERIRAA